MPFEHSIRSGQKRLRCGYTTGTCAALAAQGAARLLLEGTAPAVLTLMTPKGWEVSVRPENCRRQGGEAFCSVRKDAGDDADVTDGLPVTAAVSKTETPGIVIEGGPGVGRVTRPGLDQPVGAAAINRVPRQMIRQQAEAVCQSAGYTGGLRVVISIEGGAEAARRTFNPNLGVEGGLSILGTSGIVEPMSEQAIVDTIELEIRQCAARDARLLLTPGNYGTDFLHAQGWDARGVPVVKCSNFLGEALDCGGRHPAAGAGGPYREAGQGGGRRHEHPFPLCGLPHGTVLRPCRPLRGGSGRMPGVDAGRPHRRLHRDPGTRAPTGSGA